MELKKGQVYENAFGANCEIIDVTEKNVTYKMFGKHREVPSFHCGQIDSCVNMLTFNGYVLK